MSHRCGRLSIFKTKCRIYLNILFLDLYSNPLQMIPSNLPNLGSPCSCASPLPNPPRASLSMGSSLGSSCVLYLLHASVPSMTLITSLTDIFPPSSIAPLSLCFTLTQEQFFKVQVFSWPFLKSSAPFHFGMEAAAMLYLILYFLSRSGRNS
jgi:hypothetical protein